MCKEMLIPHPCLNRKCPQNFFWEELKLDRRRIHMTQKALQIRNCCRLIRNPWTSDEIAEVWGLMKRKVKQCEQSAWRKIHKRSYGNESSQKVETDRRGLNMD